MPQKRTIPQKFVIEAQSLVSTIYGPKMLELFDEACVQNNRLQIQAILIQALNTKDENGMPCGRRGLPTERAGAEAILKMVKEGRTLSQE